MVYQKQSLVEYARDFFMQNKNTNITPDELAFEVWGHKINEYTSNNLAVLVSSVRKILPLGYDIISTRGQGYECKEIENGRTRKNREMAERAGGSKRSTG